MFPEHQGLRLDQFLAAVTPLSRRRSRALVSEGGVLINGRVRRTQSKLLLTGDVVDLPRPGEELAAVESRPPPEIVSRHRDDWIEVLDKPSGVLSQPSERRRPGDLAMDERLLLARAWETGRSPFLRLVHRIDRVTSGLLLFARRQEALGPLHRAWRDGVVERRYVAVVEGHPSFSNQRVDAPIARVADAWRFEVAEWGKPARTEVEVLRAGEEFSLVACRLHTGRTHQVRVHLAHLGYPVAGDRLYGALAEGPGRPLLHAAGLRLPHPETGAPLNVESPLPDDFPPEAR